MTRTFAERARAFLLAGMLVFGLSACAAGSAETPAAPPETLSEAPTTEQSVASACKVGSAEVDALLTEVRDRVAEGREELAAGRIPDVAALSDGVIAQLDGITAGVTNREVLAALDRVTAEVRGFAEIPAPSSILGAPTYLAELGAQAEAVREAGAELRALCDSPE